MVPEGVAGEIYIGGPGVARGYLNRPELTAERFVEDPFSSDPSARLYKTGDLGRWRADGAVEFLGRNDLQVKIRGFRVELGEIETRIVGHEFVKDAVVVVREDSPDEKYLVAYIVPKSEAMLPAAEDLRTHLRQTLPDYMVPAAFVILSHVPLTSTGKVDRRALPAPDVGAYANREYAAPCGEAEECLALIWREVLRVSRVGRNDNFFELGGHSLGGIKLVAKIDAQFGITVPVSAIFRCPTIQEMAILVDSLRRTDEFAFAPNDDSLEFEEGVVDVPAERTDGAFGPHSEQ